MRLKNYTFLICIALLGVSLFFIKLSLAEETVTGNATDAQGYVDRLFENHENKDDKKNTAALPEEILNEKDGTVMVLIPEGLFWMGTHRGTTNHDAKLHKVYMDDYYIDKTEVTNEQYRRFAENTGHRLPYYMDDPRFNTPRQPVVGVTWKDAVAYAEWAGKRLPTEAEWEKAARGVLENKIFPWGDELNNEYANYLTLIAQPVASFKPNGYGLFDMAGNVWEWVADLYDANYYVLGPKKNPQGSRIGRFRCIRGGAFNTSVYSLDCAHRYYYDPELTNYFLGFRCAKDAIGN